MNIDIKELQKKPKPDLIWFSPPCTSFSIAGCRFHFKYCNEGFLWPISDKAKKAIDMIKKVVEIIETIQPKYWIIENPRGLLRKTHIIDNKYLKTTWYCQWGDNRAKPTDLWSNFDFEERMCKNGNKDCHHEKAPRGSKKGTQGRKNNHERSKVPELLVEHIIKTVEGLK
jgi:hypothetical protein